MRLTQRNVCALECEYIDNKYEIQSKRDDEEEKEEEEKKTAKYSDCEAVCECVCCLTVNAVFIITLPKPI